MLYCLLCNYISRKTGVSLVSNVMYHCKKTVFVIHTICFSHFGAVFFFVFLSVYMPGSHYIKYDALYPLSEKNSIVYLNYKHTVSKYITWILMFLIIWFNRKNTSPSLSLSLIIIFRFFFQSSSAIVFTS